MNEKLFLVLASLTCSVAFAQAPAGTTSRPPHQTSPSASGGTPAAKAQMNVDDKKAPMQMSAGAMPMGAAAGGSTPMSSGMGMGTKAMDTNNDRMISKAEWDSYHGKMWNQMKPKMQKGMMPTADMEAMMKGGPS